MGRGGSGERMPNNIATSAVPRQHRLPEKAGCAAAKADLRLPETDAWREQVGAAIEHARQLSGLSLKEFAAAVGRDERQIARWISGDERAQLDRLFAVEALRQSLVIALASLAGQQVEIETTIRVRRAG